MTNKQIENDSERGLQTQLKAEDQWSKIAISKSADHALIDLLTRIHDGFNAGKATKQEIASLIIIRFFKHCSDTDILDLRSEFFDPILMMEAELRKAKETGILADSVREFFRDQFTGASNHSQIAKKTKKNLNSIIIKDNVLPQKEFA